ncbi:MAG: metallophosphoesterase family protein [Xanthobacteraceae bacterium]
MFVLAHVSDLHMASRPTVAELAGKRGLGFINWQRKRKYIHRPEVLDAITRDVKTAGADHIAVTGDLVNFSLADEYRRAREWLDTLGTPRDVTVIPGNHDVYVGGALQSPAACWGEYMRGDDGIVGFPFIRRCGDVALIALSTGVPTGPFMATGWLGPRQLSRLAEALDQTRGSFRIVLIHHPPLSPLKRHLRRLTDAAELRRVLAEHGAELLLHGHDHRRAIIWLDGPNGTKIPAIGAPSASALAPHGSEDGAGYNIFRIEADASAWRIEMVGRQRAPDGSIRDTARRTIA